MLHIGTKPGAFAVIFPRRNQHFTCELDAAKFLEKMRWGSHPACVHCGSIKVRAVLDKETGERHKRLFWRCRTCYKRFTVWSGTMMEGALIPLHLWLRVLHLLDTQGTLCGKDVQQCCPDISITASFHMLRRIRSGVSKTGKAWRHGAITITRA